MTPRVHTWKQDEYNSKARLLLSTMPITSREESARGKAMMEDSARRGRSGFVLRSLPWVLLGIQTLSLTAELNS